MIRKCTPQNAKAPEPCGGVPAHNRGGGLICTGSHTQLYITQSIIYHTLNYSSHIQLYTQKIFCKKFLPKNISFVIVKKLYYDI